MFVGSDLGKGFYSLVYPVLNMNSASKPLTLPLIVLLLLSLLTLIVIPTNVQAVPKPAVPEFTVKIVDKSYNEPSTQSTDPYTGKTTTHPSYRVENKVIEITIKNQKPAVMYSIRTKGHFEEWTQNPNINGLYGATYYPDAGKYTTIEFNSIEHYPDGAQIDFQIIALLGSFEEDFSYGLRGSVFYGEKSEWSKTQTITINKNNNEITNQIPDDPETPSNPNQPTGFTWIDLGSITSIAVILSVMATFLILKRTTNRKNA